VDFGGPGVTVDRATALAALADRVRGCELCPLSRTRTLSVPGEGPADAEIMLIGEAPGMNEDRQGRPFVGAAGKFLEELLAAAGLSREDVFICNVLKCRPPSNRDPLPAEIEACSDYLDEQIDIIDPLVIVTLGRYSMARFFPRQTISRIHGTVKEVAGRAYVPMYHPAAALHQGSLREVMLNDFRKLPAILEHARQTAAVSQPAARRVAHAPESPAAAPPAPLAEAPRDAGALPPAPTPSTTQIRLFE
jgi:DNA polymerase